MTIREVAKRAGVSLQTVSNVLNGRVSQMGPETRQRVLGASRNSATSPTPETRSLRSRRTNTVAYLTVDPADRFLTDPFHTLLLSGMADLLRERDFCLLVQALPPQGPAEAFRRLHGQRRFDGAVLHLSGAPAERQRCARELAATGCPFVLIEERFQGPSSGQRSR